MIFGSVDDVSTKKVVGWVHSSIAKEPCKVQATINNKVIGEATADLFRADLAAAKLGSGHCGFEIKFTNAVDAVYLPFVEIRLAGGTLVLPRTSTTGFGDYFSALYKRFPNVGRYASVLGGFWTDRSDASALLKARVDIGRIAQNDSGSLSRFINEGLVAVDIDPALETAPARSSPPKAGISPAKRNLPPSDDRSEGVAENDVATLIAGRLFNEHILRLLSAILEDNPIAVRASVCKGAEKNYIQTSALEELPSPAETLSLIVPLAEGVSIEVLRGSHWFPEFAADGSSRWTFEGRSRVAAAAIAPNTYTDVFNLSPKSTAILGPGLIHRIRASGSSNAIRVLVLPSRQGSARFRQQAPAEELNHPSGARVWVSQFS